MQTKKESTPIPNHESKSDQDEAENNDKVNPIIEEHPKTLLESIKS